MAINPNDFAESVPPGTVTLYIPVGGVKWACECVSTKARAYTRAQVTHADDSGFVPAAATTGGESSSISVVVQGKEVCVGSDR